MMADFIRADKLEKKEKQAGKVEKAKTKKRLFLTVLLVIFFALGFALAALIFYRPPIEFPLTLIQAENVEIIPVVDRNFFNVTLTEINSASQQIDIAMFEFRFYENEENKVRLLAEALVNAAARGVKVRVLLDQSDWNPKIRKNNEPTINFLRENGVEAKFDSEKKTLHAKLLIIDDSVIVGSTNLGFHALERNSEAGVLIKSKEVADYYRTYFEQLWE